MNIYIITWIIIVGALALTFVFRAIENFRKECGNKEGDPHFFEISKDTELFYCPGDERAVPAVHGGGVLPHFGGIRHQRLF